MTSMSSDARIVDGDQTPKQIKDSCRACFLAANKLRILAARVF